MILIIESIADMLKICNRRQLIERAKSIDQIIGYGAGKRFDTLKNSFVNTSVWNKLKCIVDNDKKKYNTQICFGEKEIEIISFDELKRRNYNNYIILVICASYEEIIKQLSEDVVLKKIDFYCLYHIQLLELEESSLQKKVPLNIKLNKEPLIPKVIHYCWFGGKLIPDKYRIWMESWRKYCPDYDIVEWNEENYDVTKNDYMYQAYKNKKWGFVADYARLDVLYSYGGVYLDTDVELVQNIDDLLYEKGFSGFQSNNQVNFGLGFGAIKGLPIIKEVMDLYDDLSFLNRDGSLNLIACPILQTEILREHGLHENGEYQRVGDMTVYPEKMLCGKNMYTRRIALTSYTRAIHHFDASWQEADVRNRNIQLEKEMNQYMSDYE